MKRYPCLSHHTPIRAWSASQLGEELWSPQTWRPLKCLTVHPSHTHDSLQVAVQERETMTTKRSTGNIPERRKLVMIANLGCQLGHIGNQLKPRSWHTCERFSRLIIWGEKTHLECGPHLLVAAYIEGQGRRKLFWFGPLALALAGKVIYPVAEALLRWH